MPVGRDRAGMPVGLQLTAPAYAEEKPLAIALATERVLSTAEPARNTVAARFVMSLPPDRRFRAGKPDRCQPAIVRHSHWKRDNDR
jgi:hypothetical protein